MANRFKELSRADRLDLQILGRLTLESPAGPAESYLCNTINISLSGALVETGSSIPIGSLLRYTFSIPGRDRTLEITGEVVRGERHREAPRARGDAAEAGARNLIRYGIMFLDLKDADKSAIEEFFSFCSKRREGQEAGPLLKGD